MKLNKILLVLITIFFTINLYGKDLRSIKVEYINFNNITLNNLFGFLSKEYGINFSIEPEFRQNKVSIHLQNSNLKSLLDIITRDNGMVYKRKGDIIYITPFKQNLVNKYLTGKYKKKKVVLDYASVGDTVKFLLDLMPGQAIIRSSTINEPYSNLYNVAPSLDKPKFISEEDENDDDDEDNKTKIYPEIDVEVKDKSGDKLELGENDSLNLFIDKHVPTDILYIIPFFNTNSIYLLSTNESLLREAEDLIKDIDQPLKQVLIQGEIIQLALGDNFSSVFDIDLNTGLTNATDTFSIDGSGGTKNISFNYFNDKIKANIDIAKTDNRASTVASPMLLAMNRVSATLDLTYEAPMISGYTEPETIPVEGSAPIVKEAAPIYTTEKIGTVLEITPFINSREEILLKVQITTSDIKTDGGEVLVNNVVTKIDTVSKSIVSTTLSTVNGRAIIIGGLIKKSKTAKNVKVPLLGDIPILGIPFNDIQEEDTKEEQVIVLRPMIINMENPQSELLKQKLYKHIKSSQTLEQEIEELRAKDQERIRVRDLDKIVPNVKRGIHKANQMVQAQVKSMGKDTAVIKKDVSVTQESTEVKYDETIEEFLEE